MNALLVLFVLLGNLAFHNANGYYQNNTNQNSYGGIKGYQNGEQSRNYPNPSSGYGNQQFDPNRYQGYGNQRTFNPSANVGYAGTFNTGINGNPRGNGEYANFGQSKLNNASTRPIAGNTGTRYPNNMNYRNRNQFNLNPNGVYGTPSPQLPNNNGVVDNGRFGNFNQFRPNNTGYRNGVSRPSNIGGYGSGGQTYSNNGRFGHNSPIDPNPARGNIQQFRLNNNNTYANGRQFGTPQGGTGGSYSQPNVTSFRNNVFGVDRDWQNGNRGQSTFGNTGRYGNIGQFGSSPNDGYNRGYQGSKGRLYPNLDTSYNG